MSKSIGAEEKVNTRRLKPVYDALDGAQPKKALQEAEKVLKKQPNMPACRALKALSLIRLERSQDAFDVLSGLEKEMEALSFDDNTYSAMCHAYREAFTPERIPRMYELLCSRNPQSEQYLTHLFMSYARIRDYKKQQQVAMNLYKEFQKPAYFFWGIMSVVMQAITDQKLGSTMFFPLAEKMIEKYFENKISGSTSKISDVLNNDGELKAYLMILEGRGRYEDTIKLLEESNTARIVSHVDKKLWGTGPFISSTAAEWIFRRIVKYLKILKKHEKIHQECEKMIKSMKSDWFLIETYNESLISILKSGSEIPDGKQSTILSSFKSELYNMENFNSDEKTVSMDNVIRTKLLGRFELMSRLVKEGEVNQQELATVLDSYLKSSPLEHFKTYCNYYYRNPSCFSDIRDYLLILLNIDEQAELVKHLEESVSLQNDKSGCASIVLLERVKRLCGVHFLLTSDERWDLINSLFSAVKNSNDRDTCGAALVHIIVYLLWDIYKLEDDHYALYHISVLLEFAAEKYPGEQNIRLLACRVYGILGAPDIVQSLTRQLDVKYIQRDTLAYLMFPLAEQYGSFRNAIVYYTGLSSMYDQHEREIAECLVNGYKFSQYDQVPKFIDLWEKSTNSVYAHAADTCNQFLAPSFAVDNIDIAIQTLKGDDMSIKWDKLSDNRDLKSVSAFTVENDKYYKEVDKWKEASFVEIIDMLKYRHLICRCASLVGKETITYEEFSKQLIELRIHQEYCQKTYVLDKPSKLIQAFTPSRFAHFMKSGYFELLDLLFDSSAKLIALKDSRKGPDEKNDEPDEEKILEMLPAPDDVFNAISKFLPKITQESLKPLLVQDALFDCAESVGVIMFSIVLIKLFELLICHIFGKNPVVAVPKPNKKDKKKKDTQEAPKEKKDGLVDRFEQMKPVYGEQLVKLDSTLDILKDFVMSGEYLPIFETNHFSQEILEEHRKVVHIRLRDSYLNSINHMKDIISRTQKRFFTRFADLLPGV